MKFVNLRCFTTASMVNNGDKGAGLFDIKGALDKIKSNPSEYAPAFAITEKNNMYSVIDFYKYGQSVPNFNPIIGLNLNFCKKQEHVRKIKEQQNYREEIYYSKEEYQLLLIAKNNNGYKNLSKLQTVLMKSDDTNYILENIAESKSELFQDIFVLSGGNGEYLFNQYLDYKNNNNKDALNNIENHISLWKKISNNNYLIELQRDGTPFENDYIKFILPLAIKHQVPVVATNNTYFLNREDYINHELLRSKNNDEKLLSASTPKLSLGNKNIHKPTIENYFKSNSEMLELFKDIPIAIQNTEFLANNVNVTFSLNKENYLPEIKSPNPNEDINQFFIRLSNEGLESIMLGYLEKYGTQDSYLPANNQYFEEFSEWRDLDINPNFLSKEEQLNLIRNTKLYQKYQTRLNSEIETIISMKFPSYFLVVSDFIKWSKENNIPVGPGRGSGAGSLVAYALKITDLDPLQFGLLFERFLNPERVSMPDFDVDFAATDKDKVIDYVKRTYNKEDQIAVSKIMNVSKYEVLSAIEVAAACYGFKNNHPFIKDIKSYFDSNKPNFSDDAEHLILEDEEVDELQLDDFFKDAQKNPDFQLDYANSPVLRDILNLASKLHGNMRTVGVHASGVVIASQSIDDILPLTTDKENNIITQLNKDNSEALGIVKFDFLSLDNLNVMQHALNEINKGREKENLSPITMSDLDSLDLYDENVYKNIFQNGNTTDVFQFASAGMKKMLKNYKPDCFEDLVALVSLYRPGPMSIIPEYIATKHGKKPIDNIAPSRPSILKNILNDTYGYMIYQEQIMLIAMDYAGYSLGGADLLRRAMGKKKPEEMAKHRSIFVTGGLTQDNIPLSESQITYLETQLNKYRSDNKTEFLNNLIEHNFPQKSISKIEEALTIFDKMEKFAEYGFNKSHAAAYAKVSFQTAWLKHYYPNEYFLAVLHSHIRNKKDKDTVLYPSILDARKNHVPVLDIDINQSHENFHLNDKGQLIMPFLAMSNMSAANAKNFRYIRNMHQVQGQDITFKDIPSFIQATYKNRMPISESMLVDLIKVGAFSKLDNKHSDAFYIHNAKEILTYFAQQQPKILSPLLRTIPNTMLKSGLNKNYNKDIEFKKDIPDILLEEKISEQYRILKFIPNLNEVFDLVALNKAGLLHLKDNQESNINLSNCSTEFSEIKKELGIKLEIAKSQFYSEQQTKDNPKFNTYNLKKDYLVYGVVLDIYETKYSTYFKIATSDTVLEIESRIHGFNKKSLKKFEPYYFHLNTSIDSEYNPFTENNDFPINIKMLDYFSLGDIFEQATKNKNINIDGYENSPEEASSKIVEILGKAQLIPAHNKKNDDETESALLLPFQFSLPNGESVEILPKSNLDLVLKENKISFKIEFDNQKFIIDPKNNEYKLSPQELNGNLTEHINVSEMLNKIKNNETFAKVNQYTILTNKAALESSSVAQTGEHLLFGYLADVVRYTNKKTNNLEARITFVDSQGESILMIDKLGNLGQYKLNEPMIIKVDYARSKTNSHYYTLHDRYFEKDIEKMNLLNHSFYTHSQKFNDVLHNLSEFNPIILQGNKLNNELENNEIRIYFMHDGVTKHHKPFIENRVIKLIGNFDDIKNKLNFISIELNPIFNFNQTALSATNIPSKSGVYPFIESYNKQVNSDYRLNYQYFEQSNKGKNKLTESFVKLEQLNIFAQHATQNQQAMVMVVPSELKIVGTNTFLTITDDSGNYSLRLNKEQEVFDFNQAIENKELIVMKLKPSISKKNNQVYMNISDIYTLEDTIKTLANKMYIRCATNNPNLTQEILDFVKTMPSTTNKTAKTIEISLISNGEIIKDSVPIITQYSDELYNKMLEKFNLTYKDIFIQMNTNGVEINEHHFMDNNKQKIYDANWGRNNDKQNQSQYKSSYKR